MSQESIQPAAPIHGKVILFPGLQKKKLSPEEQLEQEIMAIIRSGQKKTEDSIFQLFKKLCHKIATRLMTPGEKFSPE